MNRDRECSFSPRLVPVLCFALAGCRESAPPAWVSLAELAEFPESAETRTTLHPWYEERNLELVQEAGRATLRIPLRRQDWRYAPELELWQMRLVLPVEKGGDAPQLATPRGPVPWRTRAELVQSREPGFSTKNGPLILARFEAEPPEEATLSCSIPRDSGCRAGRFRHGGLAGQGISLLSGVRARCRIDVPHDRVLRFGTALEPVLGRSQAPTGVLFRVLLDGEVLFETRMPLLEAAPPAWHAVPLPAAGRAGAELEFTVEGPLAYAAYIDPRIGPRDVGARGRRPWPEARPDVVVILADTFRADNLAIYGGRPGVTPNLDRLAKEGLCFTRARSTASWTLPSHASLFSGYYPPQVLPEDTVHSGLPREVETVAERLARAGYRTGAVTDGGFVSSRYGLDQGFACFDEVAGDNKQLVRLLDGARAFLAADDGRPLFLFVQTYRAHWPYLASERAREELGESLGIRGRSEDLEKEAVREAHARGADSVHDLSSMKELPRSPRMLELARELHAHYLGGASDLDHDLAGFLDELRANEVLATGYLVFTSDHGEAFLEHGDLSHHRDPFEEETRVPLLLVGRGLAARLVDEPVSLVDLAPTLMEMAGIPAAPDWPGRSLLSTGPARALFGFESTGAPEDSLFVLEQDRKVLLTCRRGAAGRLLGAFDLAEDAGEERDLSGTGTPWPRELLERHGASLEALLVPLVASEPVELDGAKEAELEALGY